MNVTEITLNLNKVKISYERDIKLQNLNMSLQISLTRTLAYSTQLMKKYRTGSINRDFNKFSVIGSSNQISCKG